MRCCMGAGSDRMTTSMSWWNAPTSHGNWRTRTRSVSGRSRPASSRCLRQPVVVGSIERGLNLEISVVDRSPDGSPFFYMVDERDDVVRVEVTDGIFGYALCRLDGIEVRTVSPLAQFQIRAGIAMAGGFGPLRPKDVTAQRALQERFYPDTPIEDLSPTIVPLPE